MKTMKRCLSLLMVTLLLCSSFSAYAADEDKIILNKDIKIAVEDMLTGMQIEKELFSMQDVNFQNLCLGAEVPVYNKEGETYRKAVVKAFPILEDNHCVTVAYCSMDANGNPLIGLGSVDVEKFNHVDLNKNIVVIVENSKVSVVNINNDLARTATFIGENTINGKLELNVGPMMRGNKYLSVPIVSQESPSLKCWAACMRSIGLYYGVNKSIDQIYTAAGIEKYNGNGDLNQITSLFNSLFGRTATHVYVSFARLKQEIDQGHPVFASNQSPAGARHATVLRGYIDGGTQSISYMNPSYPNSYWTVQIRSDGRFPCVNSDFSEWGIMHDSIIVK